MPSGKIEAALARASDLSGPKRSCRVIGHRGDNNVLPTLAPGRTASFASRHRTNPRAKVVLWLRLLGIRNVCQLLFAFFFLGASEHVCPTASSFVPATHVCHPLPPFFSVFWGLWIYTRGGEDHMLRQQADELRRVADET